MMTTIRIGFLSICYFLLSTGIAAQPGTPDSTFAADGVLSLDFGAGEKICNMQSTPGSGFYVFGVYTESEFSASSIPFATKIQSDGSTDLSFGNNGTIAPDVVDFEFIPWEGRVLSNGDVVIAGTNTGYDTLAMLRYHADGTPDTSLGPDGVAVALGNYYPKTTYDISIASDGSVFWCGGHIDALFGTVEHIHADGTYDDQFNVTSLIAPKFFFQVMNAQILNDNNLYINGLNITSETYWSYVKMSTSGSVDTDFGDDGNLIIESFDAAADEFGSTMHLDQSLDRVFTVHTAFMQRSTAITKADSLSFGYINSFSLQGEADTSFDYLQTKPIDGRRSIYTSITTHSDQENYVLIGGYAGSDTSEALTPVVKRLRMDGTADTAFGENGLYLAGEQTFESAFVLEDESLLPELLIDGNGDLYYAYNYESEESDFGCRVIKLRTRMETATEDPTLNSIAWKMVNPQSDRKWEFTLPESMKGEFSLSVFDRRGAIIANKEFSSSVNKTGQIEVPVGLSAGMYFVLLQTEEGRSVKKVVFSPHN